jgi:hypothetical protein
VRSSATASGCGSAAIKVFMAHSSQAGTGSARLARVAMPEYSQTPCQPPKRAADPKIRLVQQMLEPLVRGLASANCEFSAYGRLLIF